MWRNFFGRVGVIVLIGIVLYGVFELSLFLVRKGNVGETEAVFEFDTESMVGTEESLRGKPECVYDYDNYDGEVYDSEFESVYDGISKEWEARFLMVSEPSKLTCSNLYTSNISDTVISPMEIFEEGYDGISIRENLIIIGFLGKTVVVYAYGYPECDGREIFVVDYSGRDFIKSLAEPMKLGDRSGLLVLESSIVRSKVDDWSVYYVR